MKVDYSILDENLVKDHPFKYAIIDDLFSREEIEEALLDFPDIKDVSWWKYNNTFEKKLAFNDLNTMKPSVSSYFDTVNSLEFTRNIGDFFKIENLLSDPSLRGGGLHCIQRGGKLDIHSDFPYHKVTGWRRVINILTFMNKDWKESYGGFLELWDAEMKSPVVSIEPTFNRTVIFETHEKTYHGHPDPLSCPEHITRKSFASYYYVLGAESTECNYSSTDYKKRPSDKEDKEKEKLRSARRMGRLEDIKT